MIELGPGPSFLEYLNRDRPDLLPAHQRPRGGGSARHHHRRAGLCRRHRDGRGPARDHGQRDRQPPHREGLRDRQVLGGGHRRCRGPGHRHRQALPGRARALREDRGNPAFPGGQGQPAGLDDPLQPRHGHAGHERGAAVRRLRHGQGDRQALLLRHHRRPLRGGRAPQHRLRLGLRPRLAEEAVAAGHGRRARHPRGHGGPLRCGRRRFGHRRPGHGAQAVAGGLHGHARRAPPASPNRCSRPWPSRSSTNEPAREWRPR